MGVRYSTVLYGIARTVLSYTIVYYTDYRVPANMGPILPGASLPGGWNEEQRRYSGNAGVKARWLTMVVKRSRSPKFPDSSEALNAGSGVISTGCGCSMGGPRDGIPPRTADSSRTLPGSTIDKSPECDSSPRLWYEKSRGRVIYNRRLHSEDYTTRRMGTMTPFFHGVA